MAEDDEFRNRKLPSSRSKRNQKLRSTREYGQLDDDVYEGEEKDTVLEDELRG